MEEFSLIHDFLPISFGNDQEQEYVRILWDGFESNENGKYQFAFIAYHMLTMCAIYFNVWQIRQACPDDFDKAMVGFNKDLERELRECSTPFGFSRVGESGVMRFFKLIGCGSDKTGKYAALVRDRNDSAHSTGNIYFNSSEAIEQKVNEVLRCLREIQGHSTPVVLDLYRRFLIENWDTDNRQYISDNEQIEELLLHKHYFSTEDVRSCLAFDICSIEGLTHEQEMLHEAFKLMFADIDD